MPLFQFQKKPYFIYLGIGALIFGATLYLTKRPADVPVKTEQIPEKTSEVVPVAPDPSVVTKRPLPHISHKDTYDYDMRTVIRNVRNTLPNIKIISEIPEGFVRPRKNRRLKVEAAEPGALVTLYANFPEQPIDMCYSPCSLNTDASEEYSLITYKYGFERVFRGVDTGLWGTDEVLNISMGPNWLETYEKQKSCFEENEARRSEDRDAEICIRNPPYGLERAPKSGHCRVKFTVAKTGYIEDVQVLNCTMNSLSCTPFILYGGGITIQKSRMVMSWNAPI